VNAITKRLRLLPTVFVLAAALLLIKATALTQEARAQGAPSAPAEAAAPPAPTPDPVADDPDSSSAGEVDVLTSLSKRRAALDAREQGLTMRENLIAAAEQRVEGKIAQLKQLQDQLQTLLGQRDDAEQKQLTALVKTYSSMRPKDAARIFDSLNDEVLLAVASQMKPDVLGAILAGMQPDAAQKLTVKLANRLKLPDPQPALAANTPPPQAAPQGAPAGSPPPAAAPSQAAASAPAPAAPTSAPANNAAAPAKK
jgi:flagellar motility protein MotE (MotC chaperone)